MHSFVTLVETPTQAIGFLSINHFSNWSWVSSVWHIRVRDWCKEPSNVFNYPLSTFETRCVERVWQGAYQTTTINVRQPCCFTQLLMLSRVSTFFKNYQTMTIIISFMEAIWLKYYKPTNFTVPYYSHEEISFFFLNNEMSNSQGLSLFTFLTSTCQFPQ